jgi:hypothetical protein
MPKGFFEVQAYVLAVITLTVSHCARRCVTHALHSRVWAYKMGVPPFGLELS